MPSPDAVVLCVQGAPIACQLFHIFVNGVDQFAAGKDNLPAEDEIFPQGAQVFQIRRYGCGAGFFPPPALLFPTSRVNVRRGAAQIINPWVSERGERTGCRDRGRPYASGGGRLAKWLGD
jgi:hypothetical protein